MYRIAFTFAALAFLASSASADTPKQPNVLFIMADDLRTELGCYGSSHALCNCLDEHGPATASHRAATRPRNVLAWLPPAGKRHSPVHGVWGIMEAVPAELRMKSPNMLVNPFGIPVLKIGRDVNGRFRPGNPGGPGNPFARKVASLRKTLLDSVSNEDLKGMVEILKQQALDGERAAIKLIFQYCIGKPTAPHDPDRMDIDEWDRLQQMRVSPEEFGETVKSVPACLACDCTETDWPCEAQAGPPLDFTIRDIHQTMNASNQTPLQSDHPDPTTHSVQVDAAPQQPGPVARQTNEANTPSEASAANAARASSAQQTQKARERRVHAGESRVESQPSTQPPLPYGENERDQMRTQELLKGAFQPSQPPEQPQSKPPKG